MGRVSPASVAALVPLLTLILGLSGARSAYVLPGANMNCSQQGLSCSATVSNCLDPGWLVSHSYTPSGPDRLDLRISTQTDQRGNLLPVMSATWRLRDDGSIYFLKASELHVVTVSTNQNLCVRYTFNNPLPTKDLSGNQWTLSSDVVVLDPGQSYTVSVENIPKAELDHSPASLSQNLKVPDCSDSVMKWTKPCIDAGFGWSPDLSLSRSGSDLTVEFSPDPLSVRYLVLLSCKTKNLKKEPTRARNSSRLSASFSLHFWSCCQVHVEVLSHFPGCGNDCRRHKKTIDMCQINKTETETTGEWRPQSVALGASALVLLLLGVCVTVIVCRRRGRPEARQDLGSVPVEEKHLEERPTLLLIYSRDHPLFLHVVLQLAAFLQAQCGVLVLLDLLDSSSVSQYGVFRWLELQRQKLRPTDKILVLCSRGVQSKWRSMCGQGQVVHQPDDLIGPFLSLFLSDMHTPGSRGRYIAAFFEDLSSERDVPSFFDIAVKYKLMKHFEELYFRLLDLEKYEPRRVNHVPGIGPDEYHRCPSGRSLQSAVHAFAAFQLQHPDWFENADAEEADESSPFIENTPLPQILECAPIVRDPAPIFTHDVLVNETAPHFYIAEPEVKREAPISLNEPLPTALAPDRSVLELRPNPRPNMDIFKSEVVPNAAMQIPVEDEEEEAESGAESGLRAGQNAEWAESGVRAGQSAEWAESEVRAGQSAEWAESGMSAWRSSEAAESGVSVEQSEEEAASVPCLKPLEEGAESKGQSSASDQGYSSRVWTEPDSEHMRALLKLQQELMSEYCRFEVE